MQADYVIVGAGSAGCVLATRLTEDANTNVILIEAGGKDTNPLIHVPAGFFKMLDHDKLTWKYRSEPDPGTNGRAIVYTRGRVVGGSSSINGLVYIRGQPEDYDHWAQLGNRGWSWDDCLPLFRAAEHWEGQENEVRGKDGPLTHVVHGPLPALRGGGRIRQATGPDLPGGRQRHRRMTRSIRSAGASRPATDGGGPARRAPIWRRRCRGRTCG